MSTTLTINPTSDGGGPNIYNLPPTHAIDATVTFTGTISDYHGQQLVLDLHSTSRTFIDYEAGVTVNANGTWSASISDLMFDGRPGGLYIAQVLDYNGVYDDPIRFQDVPTGATQLTSEMFVIDTHGGRNFTDTAAHIQAIDAATLASLPEAHIISSGPGDTEFSIAQAKAMESSGTMVSGPAGAHVELSDSAAHVLDLLGGNTWADVLHHLTDLQHTGIQEVDVQLPKNHEFEFSVDHAILDAQHMVDLHGQETVAHQTFEIQHFEHQFWHV